jgi:hypothetical protein
VTEAGPVVSVDGDVDADAATTGTSGATPADGTTASTLGRTSPLRRLIGVLGLLALVPTAWMLFKDQITVADAGQRAAVTYVAVRIALRLSAWGIASVAQFLDKPEA